MGMRIVNPTRYTASLHNSTAATTDNCWVASRVVVFCTKERECRVSCKANQNLVGWLIPRLDGWFDGSMDGQM